MLNHSLKEVSEVIWMLSIMGWI